MLKAYLTTSKLPCKEIKMEDCTKVFMQNLVKQCDSLSAFYLDHISYYDELLPHVFMGEITRQIISGNLQRQKIVEHLSEAFRTGDEEVKNLIAASFIENIETEEELEFALKGVKESALRTEWHKQQM